MKAVIMTGTSSALWDTLFRKRKKPNLTELVLSLESLAFDEILIVSQNAVKSRLSDWFEKERNHFQTPVASRFYDGFADSGQMEPLMRLVRHEGLEQSVLLVFVNEVTSLDLRALKKAFYVYPYSPVVGVRKSGCNSAAGAVSLGERNRITCFSSNGDRLKNGWEPVGLYYFPDRFLLEGIPAFAKFASKNSPAFESFVSWSVRNFKVYAHVFAAHPGL